jgi:membrane protein YdbS with pleckstrin-like domain
MTADSAPSTTPPPAPRSPASRWALIAIMAAILIWGLLLALGSFLFDLNPLKPLIVTGCVLAFLTLWLLALISRRRRLRRTR